MKLDEFKEDIYKCSGCGLCQSVCPVYKILKKESAVSRGKFKLLNAIVNKDIKFSKKTLEFMDMCLHCQACSEFCPSGIDAQKIIETAQYDMLGCGIFNFPKIAVAQIFSRKIYLNLIKFFIRVLRITKVLDILCCFNFKKIKLLQAFLKINIPKIRQKSDKTKTIRALYFKGCINNYINPSVQNAVEKVLDKTEVEVIEAPFYCCGLPMKSAGDFESFIEVAKKNIDAISDIEFDYLIFDCASCKSTFLSYVQFLQDEYKEKAQNIVLKAIGIYELLKIIDYKPSKKLSKINVTCHYPCHTRFSNDKKIMAGLIKKIPNVEFVQMQDADSCCGAAGSFMFAQSSLSKQISAKKAENIIETDAQVVLTACPACFLGLKQGLLEKNNNTQVMQLVEFLAQ